MTLSIDAHPVTTPTSEYSTSHRRRAALLTPFIWITAFHWLEHLAQAAQVWGLKWDRADSNGLIGLAFPSLVQSEVLHFAYAIVMLVGLAALRPVVHPAARFWWTVALGVQAWHFVEHALLQAQYIFGFRLAGREDPTSVIQLVFPRIELHMLYNLIVIVPMMLALSLHWFPPELDEPSDGNVDGTAARLSPSAAPG